MARAIGLARDAGARRAVELPVSVPSHSSLMTSAGEELAEVQNDQLEQVLRLIEEAPAPGITQAQRDEIGGACVEACRETNAPKFPDPQKPFPKMIPERVKVSDWSDKQDVDDRLTPYNWLFIQTATVVVDGEVKSVGKIPKPEEDAPKQITVKVEQG